MSELIDNEKHSTLTDTLESMLEKLDMIRKNPENLFMRNLHIGSLNKQIVDLKAYIIKTGCNFTIF